MEAGFGRNPSLGGGRFSTLPFPFEEAAHVRVCRVVLVEDNPADILLVEMAMEEHSVVCELLTFHDGQQALRALCPPQEADADAVIPDLILLDLNTPKIDGFQVLLRLKETPRLAQVPIAILTSSMAASDKARADRLGASRYIRKPSQLDAFLAEVGKGIKELLDGGASASRSTSDGNG